MNRLTGWAFGSSLLPAGVQVLDGRFSGGVSQSGDQPGGGLLAGCDAVWSDRASGDEMAGDVNAAAAYAVVQSTILA